MEENQTLSISDFAEFSQIPRDTLLFYDKAGVLSPVSREANGYRRYSQGQIALVNVIRVFQELGMTLTEIKEHIVSRTPEKIEEVLKRQAMKISTEIEKLERSRKLLLALERTVHSVADVDESKITVQFFPREVIMLGEPNDHSLGDAYDALPAFYRAIKRKYSKSSLNYPAWGLFSQERILRRDWQCPDRYYFVNPEGDDEKPAGLYAIGYARGGYGRAGDLYERLLNYIDENAFEVCGNAYEEYPLNELCVSDSENYLVRVMIGVRERK